MQTAEHTLADLVELLLKVLPEKRRLVLLTITDIDSGA